MVREMSRAKVRDALTGKKMRKEILRPPRGETGKTAVVKIIFAVDPGFKKSDFAASWSGVLIWKEGLGYRKRKVFFSEKLSDVVGDVSKFIRLKLKEMEGKVESVDVIFKMPMGSDHKMTIRYEDEGYKEIEAIVDQTRDDDLNAYD